MEECRGLTICIRRCPGVSFAGRDAEFRFILFARFVPANFDKVPYRFDALRPAIDEERDL
jgi:hypothetical protein